MVDDGLADCGAVVAMEVVRPSSVGLRGRALNHPQVHWLKTVVLSVVGKVVTRARQVWVGEMSDGRKSSAVDVSKFLRMMSKPGSRIYPGTSLEVTRDGGHEILPVGGHRNSPVAATNSPHGWPSDLPTVLS
jgi:hypothetical protein